MGSEQSHHALTFNLGHLLGAGQVSSGCSCKERSAHTLASSKPRSRVDGGLQINYLQMSRLPSEMVPHPAVPWCALLGYSVVLDF